MVEPEITYVNLFLVCRLMLGKFSELKNWVFNGDSFFLAGGTSQRVVLVINGDWRLRASQLTINFWGTTQVHV